MDEQDFEDAEEQLAPNENTAQPQRLMVEGAFDEVWPEFWGITVEQCRALMDECKQNQNWSPDNNVADLVRDYVKPKTAGTGMSYAVMVNQAAPLEVNVMVSHAWYENAEEFILALERTVQKDDAMFICAFSLYQCEDACGPTISEQLGTHAAHSPFRRVLRHIRCRGEEAGWRWAYSTIGRVLSFIPVLLFMLAVYLFSYPIVNRHCLPSATGCWWNNYVEDQIMTTLSSNDSETWEDGKRAMEDALSEALTFRFDSFDSSGDTVSKTCYYASVCCVVCSIFVLVALRSCNPYTGRMVAVPNAECDLYSRLWCVYEIFVASAIGVPARVAHTLVSAGKCSSEDAQCTQEEDRNRIRREIEDWAVAKGKTAQDGFAMVNNAINRMMARLRIEFVAVVLVGLFLYFNMLATSRALGSYNSTDTWVLRLLVWSTVTWCVVGASGVLYTIAVQRQGAPSASCICCTSCFFATGGCFVFHIFSIAMSSALIGHVKSQITSPNKTIFIDESTDEWAALTNKTKNKIWFQEASQKFLSMSQPMTLLFVLAITLQVLLCGARCLSKAFVHYLQLRPTFFTVSAFAAVTLSSWLVTYYLASHSATLVQLYPLTVSGLVYGPPLLGPFYWIPAAIWWGTLRWGVRVGKRLPGEWRCIPRCCWWYSCCGCCGLYLLCRSTADVSDGSSAEDWSGTETGGTETDEKFVKEDSFNCSEAG